MGVYGWVMIFCRQVRGCAGSMASAAQHSSGGMAPLNHISLPAHPAEEVEQCVLDHPRSVIFDEAENRLHIQKAVMAKLAQAARR